MAAARRLRPVGAGAGRVLRMATRATLIHTHGKRMSVGVEKLSVTTA